MPLLSGTPMLLLSPFLTVLRIDSRNSEIIHARLFPDDAGALDLSLDVPSTVDRPTDVPGLPGARLEPCDWPPRVRLVQGGRTLCVDPTHPRAFLIDHAGGQFGFLITTEGDLANLRYLLAHRWATADGQEATLVPENGFRLDMGGAKVDVARDMPRLGNEEQAAQPDIAHFDLVSDRGAVRVFQIGDARRESLLQQAPAYCQPAEAASVAAFRTARDSAFKLPGSAELFTLPLVVCDADRDWLYEPGPVFPQHVGRHTVGPSLVRQHDKCVMLSRFVEGVVFDAHGAYGELGYLDLVGRNGDVSHPLPPGMRREGERLFVDLGMVDDTPVLPGPYVVFYGGTLSNYTHWLIDGMLPLHVLLPHLPPDTRLLLPPTLRQFRHTPNRICDHHDILRAFGFGDLPAVEIDAPYCRVDVLYWLENCGIHNMPAEHVQALRAHVAALRPTPARRDLKIYIARRQTRRVANASVLERFLGQKGFGIFYLEDFSIDAQIDLFAQADWVVGPHGAEMGNLLFCQPGTKFLELAPDDRYRHYFSYMCNKLGLAHAILPCPTDENGFFGDMTVDMEKFAALFRMLKNRL